MMDGPVLAIKLADLGDAITARPALRALCAALPGQVDLLTSRSGAAVLSDLPGLRATRVTNRHLVDSLSQLVKAPSVLMELAELVGTLARSRYRTVLLLHHLTTSTGAFKWRTFLRLIGAPTTVGLDNGRGGFLTTSVPDRGFAALHEVEYANAVVDAFGIPVTNLCLSLSTHQEDTARAEALLAPLGDARYAVVHPGSGGYSVARRWAPERFAAVADWLQRERGLSVVVVGLTPEETEPMLAAAQELVLDLTQKTSVGALTAVLNGANLFVGGDSGVMHVAAGTGVPMMALFGLTDARAWGPWRPAECGAPSAVVIQGDCPFDGPCLYRGHTLGRRDGCPTRPCLTELTVERVQEAADAALRA